MKWLNCHKRSKRQSGSEHVVEALLGTALLRGDHQQSERVGVEQRTSLDAGQKQAAFCTMLAGKGRFVKSAAMLTSKTNDCSMRVPGSICWAAKRGRRSAECLLLWSFSFFRKPDLITKESKRRLNRSDSLVSSRFQSNRGEVKVYPAFL